MRWCRPLTHTHARTAKRASEMEIRVFGESGSLGGGRWEGGGVGMSLLVAANGKYDSQPERERVSINTNN